MRVALIGWDRCGAVGADAALLSLDTRALAAPLPDDVSVVVVGPAVAVAYSAEQTAVRLERFGGATLVLREACHADAWTPSEASGVGEVVDGADAVERSLELARTRPLARMSLHQWIGARRHGLSAHDRRLLRLVPRLPRLRGYEWAQTAGISEHLLSCATRRVFDRPAGSVLREYRMRAALRLRAMGFTMASIAPVLGYSSRAAVSRALRTHGAGLSAG